RYRKARACAQRRHRVGRFHRPDTSPEPLHEWQVVGVSAEERLAQVDMRLDETRQNVSIQSVDGSVVRTGEVRSNCGDTSVVNRQIALDDVEAVVHRQDQAAADEQGSGQVPSLKFQVSRAELKLQT